MIKIFIQGLKDGLHDVELEEPAGEVPDIFPEFFGNIIVKGKLRKFGKRYSFTGKASCDAKLVCDLTLDEFTEKIKADISVSFLADTDMFRQGDDAVEAEFEENVIHEDEKHIDITKEVRDQLALNIPMKKVSPENRGKDFSEIYPEYSRKKSKEEKKEVDERWSALNKLKFN